MKNIMTKQQRLKLPKYLALVGKYVNQCVLCGNTECLQIAHYSGKYSDRLGNGMGSKSHDYCVAKLCHQCHTAFDGYKDENDDKRAKKFLFCIAHTMRLLQVAKSELIPAPAELRKRNWVYHTLFGLHINDNDAEEMVNFLSKQRNKIEKSEGK